jgi:hypothetical protein
MEVVMVYLEVISQHLFKGTKEKHGMPQAEQRVSGSRFEWNK